MDDVEFCALTIRRLYFKTCICARSWVLARFMPTCGMQIEYTSTSKLTGTAEREDVDESSDAGVHLCRYKPGPSPSSTRLRLLMNVSRCDESRSSHSRSGSRKSSTCSRCCAAGIHVRTVRHRFSARKVAKSLPRRRPWTRVRQMLPNHVTRKANTVHVRAMLACGFSREGESSPKRW